MKVLARTYILSILREIGIVEVISSEEFLEALKEYHKSLACGDSEFMSILDFAHELKNHLKKNKTKEFDAIRKMVRYFKDNYSHLYNKLLSK